MVTRHAHSIHLVTGMPYHTTPFFPSFRLHAYKHRNDADSTLLRRWNILRYTHGGKAATPSQPSFDVLVPCPCRACTKIHVRRKRADKHELGYFTEVPLLQSTCTSLGWATTSSHVGENIQDVHSPVGSLQIVYLMRGGNRALPGVA